MREFVRAVVLAVLVFLVANDVKEILTSLSSSSSLRPVVDWMYPVSKSSYGYRTNRKLLPSGSGGQGEGEDSDEVTIDGTRHLYASPHREVVEDVSLNTLSTGNYNDNDNVIGDQVGSSEYRSEKQQTLNPLQDPALEAVRKKLQASGFITATGGEAGASDSDGHSITEFTDEEKQQISVMKAHLTNVMQQWCLPKLVCELHATITDRGSLSDAELGLLSLIKETTLGTMGEVVSRYHFAAHMGQLLSGVDGNGCHNLYPNCPLSGRKVLQMVKKVRVR